MWEWYGCSGLRWYEVLSREKWRRVFYTCRVTFSCAFIAWSWRTHLVQEHDGYVAGGCVFAGLQNIIVHDSTPSSVSLCVPSFQYTCVSPLVSTPVCPLFLVPLCVPSLQYPCVSPLFSTRCRTAMSGSGRMV